MNTKIIVLTSIVVILVAICASIIITSNNKKEKFDQTTTSTPNNITIDELNDVIEIYFPLIECARMKFYLIQIKIGIFLLIVMI